MLSAVAARQKKAAEAQLSGDVSFSSHSKPASSIHESSSSSASSDSDSDSDSNSDGSVDSEYMTSLLSAAKKNMSAKALGKQKASTQDNADILLLGEEKESLPMPALDPGSSLPKTYLKIPKKHSKLSTLANDPDVERIDKLASTASIAASLPPPPELSKNTGLPMTKAEKKAIKDATAGPGWFDLPAPPASELPRLAREVDAMRLRNALDPKRFYRKEDTKAGPLPKHFAIGHIMTTPTPFGGPSRDDLPRASRKRTIVDELIDDDEARTYAKRKFTDLQGVRGERGRGTYKRKFAGRQKKF